MRRGERNRVVDYVAPPLMLSRESTDNEQSWSLGTYVAPEAIAEAFKLSGRMIAPVGVYANQPNPWQETSRRVFSLFWKLALAAVVLRGCPPPWVLPEVGHFVPEAGAVLAERALAHFADVGWRFQPPGDCST